MKDKNERIGSKLDDLLAQEGILAEIGAVAVERVLAWQIENAKRKTEMVCEYKSSQKC